ncbi:MAG TPA: archaemetzincin family Zn-dependent metalloprotease [Terriglobales bacterium]|jgi:archaemetzincin
MKQLQLLPIGDVDAVLLRELVAALAGIFQLPCQILEQSLDPEFAFHGERQQYHSSELLSSMQAWVHAEAWRLLGVTGVDLYIPILTFVFGEAQMGGPCSVVSLHRLRQEFYGLPANHQLLRDRLIKEAVHEIGHTLSLTHCQDYGCAMAPSHAVEWIDLKSAALCKICHNQITQSER